MKSQRKVERLVHKTLGARRGLPSPDSAQRVGDNAHHLGGATSDTRTTDITQFHEIQ